MNTDLLKGKLVRLIAADPQVMAENMVYWSRDSEYWRLSASDPARPFTIKATKDWIERLQKDQNTYMFGIQTLQDDLLIGEIGLDGVNTIHRDTFVGIGIGDPQYWGQGYGTDAMHIIIRYAFLELNLLRISLTVFEYNQRAIRSYEKVGFLIEGCARQFINRDGRRWDMIYMGLSRDRWVEA